MAPPPVPLPPFRSVLAFFAARSVVVLVLAAADSDFAAAVFVFSDGVLVPGTADGAGRFLVVVVVVVDAVVVVFFFFLGDDDDDAAAAAAVVDDDDDDRFFLGRISNGFDVASDGNKKYSM